MKKKSTLAVISLLAMLLVLCTACGASKTALTAEQFTQQSEDAGFQIADATDQFEAGVVDSVTIAVGDNYQLEFYVLPDSDQAASAFEQNKTSFEDAADGAVTTNTSTSGSNFSTYTQSADGQYYLLSRIDSTMLYCVANGDYADEIKEIVKTMGYL